MTKLLIAKVRYRDGSEATFRTYANASHSPRRALWGIIPLTAKIVSYEWIDTLSERRRKWNEEYPDTPIPLDS